MDFIYGLISFLIVATVIVGPVMFVRPRLLQPILKQQPSRKKILLSAFALLFVLGGLAGATEPESLKQARILQEQAAEAARVEAEKLKLTQKASASPVTQTQPKVETKEVSESSVIAFEMKTRDDSSLDKGTTKVVQEGKDGERVTTYRVTYTDGAETAREKVGESVKTEAVDKIIANGTYVKPAPVRTYTAPAPTYSAPTQSSGSVYYKNCTAARAAGPTPIYRGQPGYASHLDRDNDGIACE